MALTVRIVRKDKESQIPNQPHRKEARRKILMKR